MKKRTNVRLVCNLPIGEWKIYTLNGSIIAVCKDHEPVIIVGPDAKTN